MPFPQLENAKGQLWLQLHFAWANAVTIVIRPVHRGDIFWHGRLWCIPRNPPSLLPFPFGKRSHSSGPSSSTSFTLQVGKTSTFILHTATAVPYFSYRSQAGVCFQCCFGYAEFHYDCRYVSSRSTSHSLLAKSVGRDTAAILGCKSHVTSPQKKKYFKMGCPWAFGCFVLVFFFPLSKSHIIPFPPDLGQQQLQRRWTPQLSQMYRKDLP